MSGLLLLTNIDNFLAELFRLQLDKNHTEVAKNENYLVFKVCGKDTDVAYWYVIVLFILNMVNNTTLMLLSKYEYCPNTELRIQAKEVGERHFSNNFWKVLYYINYSSWIIQFFWIFCAFLVIPLLAKILNLAN